MPSEPMEHAHIVAHGLIDRYRRGGLAPEEEARFEEHFFGCPECAAELEAARSFALGMKAAAAEDAERAARLAHLEVIARAAGIAGWLARRGRFARGALAAAALLLAAVLPAAWVAGRAARREAALAGARDGYRRQWEDERGRSAELGRRLAARAAAGNAAAGPGDTGEAAPDRLAQGGPVARAAAPWLAPLVDTPLVFLHTLRGEASAGAAATRIDAARAAGPLTLAVEATADDGAATYRLELYDARGRSVLRRTGLHPNALDTLLVTFPPSFFAPGAYRLDLAGVTPGGEEMALGSYPLQVEGGGAAPRRR